MAWPLGRAVLFWFSLLAHMNGDGAKHEKPMAHLRKASPGHQI
jgi:hypothetical protein